jgi:hypothetical protein
VRIPTDSDTTSPTKRASKRAKSAREKEETLRLYEENSKKFDAEANVEHKERTLNRIATILGVLGDIMYGMIEIIANHGKEVDLEVDRDLENIITIWPPLNFQYHQRMFTGK